MNPARRRWVGMNIYPLQVWLIFLASHNPIVNKLLHSFVILSASEGSGLRKGLEILRSTAFRSE
jgi:hypothetical protein